MATKTIDAKIKTCSVCGKKLILSGKNNTEYSVDKHGLKKIGAKTPSSGWHWLIDHRTGKIVTPMRQMFPVCEKCYNLINAPQKRAKIVKSDAKNNK